jgi:hypothetical protein
MPEHATTLFHYALNPGGYWTGGRARTIRHARPNMPMVVVSGCITQKLHARATAAGVRELICKPHEVEELRDVAPRLITPRIGN